MMGTVDADQFRTVLEAIRSAVPEARLSPHARPPLPGAEPEGACQALRAVLDAVQGAGGPTRFRAGSPWDPRRTVEAPLGTVLRGLHEGLVLDLKRCLGGEDGLSTLAALRRDESVPDFLSLAGIPANEIAHSGVIRSLLDPGTSPAIAPRLLMGLVEAVFETEDASAWRRSIQNALQPEAGTTPNVWARTEFPVVEDADVQGRIDVLVSGPDFVLAIENKTLSFEHDDQTRTYERWMNRRPRSVLRAGIFLTIGGTPAVSSLFRPLSYVRLLGMLLQADRCCPAASPQERVLLGSYIKTLDRVLAKQISTLER